MNSLNIKSLLLPAALLLTSFHLPEPVAMIFGYNNSMVIAMVTSARLDQVAYTSFESADQGLWSYSGTTAALQPAKTGIQYYTLSSGNIQRSSLPAGIYTLSVWSKSGTVSLTGSNYTLIRQTSDLITNGWNYNEFVFQLSTNGSSVTVSGSALVDELRLHPVNANMTTYTYDPLVGKTSETDINNITTYFEYDEFNRIKCEKDQFGNIRNSYTYHYKN